MATNMNSLASAQQAIVLVGSDVSVAGTNAGEGIATNDGAWFCERRAA